MADNNYDIKTGQNRTWIKQVIAASPVALHAVTHKLGGADVILLNEFGLPTAAVNFNGYA